jgi:hypothetical protein
MNSFTGNIIPSEFLNIFGSGGNKTVTVEHDDGPYYYLRTEELALKKENPYTIVGFPGQVPLSNHSGFYEMPATSNKEIDAEVNFLKSLGLVIERDSSFYIYDLAEVFYGPQGLFRSNKGAAPAVLSVLYNYVLPGRFWTAYYTRSSLPDEVQLAGALEEHIKDIHTLVMSTVK